MLHALVTPELLLDKNYDMDKDNENFDHHRPILIINPNEYTLMKDDLEEPPSRLSQGA
jgi:hypothetical protein